MKIAVLKETKLYEHRVAITLETVKKFKGIGFSVSIQEAAGEHSHISDHDYKAAGAEIEKDLKALLKGAQIILSVNCPPEDTLKHMEKGSHVICILGQDGALAQAFEKHHLNLMAMEFIPRITRAQSMDVLSSQANLAGYRSVVEALHGFDRAFPMMMTAAGTIPPARVTILGAGVAGLQAIATAKRMGAVVSAFDVRAAAKEQVESLGASFISVESDETGDTASGYAKEMSQDYQQRQSQRIHDALKKSDIVICTAQIPGREAPRLVTEEMLKDMKKGSVIVDLAVESGGNCYGSEVGKVTHHHDVKIIGYANMPSRIPVDASQVYAKNLLSFLSLLVDAKTQTIHVNFDDEIIKAVTIVHDGKIIHDRFQNTKTEKKEKKSKED